MLPPTDSSYARPSFMLKDTFRSWFLRNLILSSSLFMAGGRGEDEVVSALGCILRVFRAVDRLINFFMEGEGGNGVEFASEMRKAASQRKG